MKDTTMTRRGLLASAVSFAALRATAPSDRVTVGIIGTGGRGVFETGQYPWFDNVEIVALCDAQESRRVAAKAKLESRYAEAGRPRTGMRLYRDYREMLAAPGIDAVYIATPDHWHVAATLAALKAGKHCHTEKPLGVSVAEDLAARDAVHRSGKVFQYGAERRSAPDGRKAVELIANGRIGKVQKIWVVAPPGHSGASATPVVEPPPGFDYNLWLGPAPMKPFCADRCLSGSQGRNGIFSIYDYSLGTISNWGAHPMDQVQRWADHTGRKTIPLRYQGTGTIASGGLFDTLTHWDVRCTYADGLELHMVDNESYRRYTEAPHPEMPWGRAGVTNVHNGAVFVGSEGWIIICYEKVVASRPAVLDSEIAPGEIHLPDSSLATVPAGLPKGQQQLYTASHHQNWIRAIREGTPTVGDIDGAVRSDLACQLAELAVRTGHALTWDEKKETIRGNNEARKRMRRKMRAPWSLA
jgi:hypothetical protein